ncbi:MAG TPA: permease [Methylomirabilota bacterium]|nr:permease [Methylomirabilota bacterium]
MSGPGTLVWFARHECRLAWRDWLSMMTAGRRRRARSIALGLVVFVLFMHGLAYVMVGRYAHVSIGADKTALLVITGNALLSAMLMLSQAMESVTRAFYTRGDLDLILSSPASARRLFSVRIAAMALSITVMAMLLAAPFIDVLAVGGGARWLGAYGVVAAMGMASTAFAVALTVALFRTLGPRRTRLVAQIVAAVIGAAFVIGLQVAAIFSAGTLSRIAFLQSPALAALTPDAGSVLWWPARAMLGDVGALVAVLAASMALLGGAILVFAPRFADHALAAAGVAAGATHRRGRRRGFRRMSPMQALRRKEWALLRRDPWLLSQTLMQLLYLLPPALLLWRGFASGMGIPALLVPVLVMAAGQLAGGLAWLAISGEDAPDLIASAPVSARAVMRAKIEAVLGAVALVFAPFVAALMLGSPAAGLVAALFIVIVAAASTAIQFWFRSQARRSQFRRRQTSSRIATFAEALSSVLWSATAALAALGTWLAVAPGLLALAILAGTRFISPARR